MKLWLIPAVLCIFAFVPACSDNTGGAGGSGNGGNGATGGNGGTGGMNQGSTPCPTTEPMPGAACSIQDLQCSYGESPFPMCRPRYRCDMGQWILQSAACQQEPAACMPSPPEGTACPGQGSYCVDGTKLCMCPVCGGAGCPPEPWVWSCSAPPAMGCPAIVPNAGTSCTDATLVCEYGIMCNEYARVQCKNNLWVWDPDFACP